MRGTLSMIDFVVVSGRFDEAMTEYAGHLHEHFVDPIEISRGRYRAPWLLDSAPK